MLSNGVMKNQASTTNITDSLSYIWIQLLKGPLTELFRISFVINSVCFLSFPQKFLSTCFPACRNYSPQMSGVNYDRPGKKWSHPKIYTINTRISIKSTLSVRSVPTLSFMRRFARRLPAMAIWAIIGI